MKKIIAMLSVLTAFLMVITSIPAVEYKETSMIDNIIYVDDNNENESWYDATHVRTIQEGIDNASSGDTVFVYKGTYYENVIINKSDINLEGEDKETVIIDGGNNGNVINMISFGGYGKANNLNIKKFTIRNGFQAGIYNSYGVNLQVSQCIFKDNIFGIHCWHPSQGKIFENILQNNFAGIIFDYADRIEISENYAYKNSIGILIDTSDAIHIIDNNITENSQAGLTIIRDFDPKEENTIEKNNFILNRKNAYFKKHSKEGCNNKWIDNYWHDFTSGFLGIKIIIGEYDMFYIDRIIPWPQFDRRPAKEPYDIDVI